MLIIHKYSMHTRVRVNVDVQIDEKLKQLLLTSSCMNMNDKENSDEE